MAEIAIGAGIAIAGLKAIAHFGGPKPEKWERPPDTHYSKYEPGEPVFDVDPKAEAKIRFAKEGTAAIRALTVPELFDQAVALHPNEEALRVEKGDENWKVWTWAQYQADSKKVACGFMSFGMKQHDCVNIIGFNSPEWFIAQMGTIIAGGKAAGVCALASLASPSAAPPLALGGGSPRLRVRLLTAAGTGDVLLQACIRRTRRPHASTSPSTRRRRSS
jgi:non-ribosomal peptide synthetase component F